MERDPLEDFIRDNRDAFDTEYPGLGIWNQIERQLPAQPKGLQRRLQAPIWRVAAAVVLLLFAGGIIGRQLGMQAMEEQQAAVIQQLAPDFPELERYYEQEIRQRYAQLTHYEATPNIEQDLQAIDREMDKLRKDLLAAPVEERAFIVENLINSYRLKLQILERILTRLRAAETQTKDHETTQSI